MNQEGVQKDSQLKKTKREDNLKSWKWDEVIEIDSSEDEKDDSDWDQLFDNILLGDLMNEHDEAPKEPKKRKIKNEVRIFSKNKVRRLFEDDDDKDVFGIH